MLSLLLISIFVATDIGSQSGIVSLTSGTITCSYSGGFAKGMSDFKVGSYGADPDRFCFGLNSDARSDFMSAYDEGRDHAYLFEKAKITIIPHSRSAFLELLKEARGLMAQAERPSPQTTNFEERLKALEAENADLKNQLTILRGLNGTAETTEP